MTVSEFVPFQKIARLFREVVITEKIDGTNAQVLIVPANTPSLLTEEYVIARNDAGDVMAAGSRNRYLSVEKDNFGFAKWVKANADALWSLGPGTHYGEWWGAGVQRGYGKINGEKRFSLFNVGRWYDEHGTNTYGTELLGPLPEKAQRAPHCCYVVPILAVQPKFSTDGVDSCMCHLRASGSQAAPGFMKPEGIVAFHSAGGVLFKATLEGDEKPKGSRE